MIANCFVCGKPVDHQEAHWCHEESCPNYGKTFSGDDSRVLCKCNLDAHPECCPVCNEEKKRRAKDEESVPDIH